VAALGEGVADHLAHERGVIDDEYACHRNSIPSLGLLGQVPVTGTRSGDRTRFRRLEWSGRLTPR